ncbi:glycoside hydrolase family 127 protein, partial [Mesorhizobium sp. M2D.F.Ca.ET.145.01.1.1]
VNGETVDIEDVTSDGYAAIRRNWKKGDRVRLDLEMPIERLYANPEVRQDAGRVALSRGPLIYCVEATDNDTSLHRLTLPRTAGIEAHDEPDLLGGVVTLAATAQADAGDGWQDGLYRSEPPAKVETRLTAIPYFAWDNREPGEMLVWLRDG